MFDEVMPRVSKRAVFMNELADAFFSHSMFMDAHNLLCNDSSDNEVVSSKIVAAVQYAAMCNV